MNVNAGHERTSKARIIHQIQLIRGITNILSMFKSLLINSLKHNTLLHFILYDLIHFLP
ncbi:hypothetical protein [Shigella dysenteriae]|nr:hypothetical protein [Shigella dysenteriae]WNT50143.1 hypothetical protein PWP84_17260 [Shigella dysenteriae]